jgi:hypothetical protein
LPADRDRLVLGVNQTGRITPGALEHRGTARVLQDAIGLTVQREVLMGSMASKRSAFQQTMQRSALTVATGLVLGGLGGGFLRLESVTGPGRQTTQPVQASDRCAGGDEVSAFVCRNNWLANTKHYAARN